MASISFNVLSIAQERQMVLRSLQEGLRENAKWEPISMEWFHKWKIYTNADGNHANEEV